MNSKYKNNIYNYENKDSDSEMAVRYIDWTTGPTYPRILNEDDFYKIKNSACLFARKFDDNLDFDKYRKIFIDNL